MKYCEDALKLLSNLRQKKVVCGKGCPIFENCPRLILEDANDEVDEINSRATKQAIEALFKIVKK